MAQWEEYHTGTLPTAYGPVTGHVSNEPTCHVARNCVFGTSWTNIEPTSPGMCFLEKSSLSSLPAVAWLEHLNGRHPSD